MRTDLTHHASPEFWECYAKLPKSVQRLADKNFALLKDNPHHPSLHFKKRKGFHSVRVGLFYRALGIETASGVVWFWIGDHSEYDRILR